MTLEHVLPPEAYEWGSKNLQGAVFLLPHSCYTPQAPCVSWGSLKKRQEVATEQRKLSTGTFPFRTEVLSGHPPPPHTALVEQYGI